MIKDLMKFNGIQKCQKTKSIFDEIKPLTTIKCVGDCGFGFGFNTTLVNKSALRVSFWTSIVDSLCSQFDRDFALCFY